MKRFLLSFQAAWRCGRSGACCTSGWPIPVEPEVEAGVERALDEGRLTVREPRSRLFTRPAGEGYALLGMSACGQCAFFEPGEPHACRVQDALGHEALPVACRLFPRVCLLEPRGVSIALSHYCPTVAARTLSADAGATIVPDPVAFGEHVHYEGLDARSAPPPLLRPGVFLDWSSHELFERHAVALLGALSEAPERALARLAGQAERGRAWQASLGLLEPWLRAALHEPAPPPDWLPADPLALVAELQPVLVQPAGELLEFHDLLAQDARYVEPVWQELQAPVGRYLATKAFASWCAHQGEGLRTRVLHLAACLATVRAQAARLCGAARRPLDAPLLLEALRAADLLLVHLVSPERLAARLSSVERSL